MSYSWTLQPLTLLSSLSGKFGRQKRAPQHPLCSELILSHFCLQHAVILPDGEDQHGQSSFGADAYVTANQNLTLNSLIGAAFGAAGQRCMAISVG